MNNEEFEGHLLACLHGPNATKIAVRIAHVFMSQPNLMGAAGQALVDNITGPIDDRIGDLELVVVADHQYAKHPESPSVRAGHCAAIGNVVASVSSRLRECGDVGLKVAGQLRLNIRETAS